MRKLDMPKFKEIESYYRRLLDALIKLAAAFSFDGTHKLHVYAVFFYGSIIELSDSLIPLLETEHYSAIPIILRSILEAYVNIENLCKEPEYGYSLELKYLGESLKFLNEARNEKDAYLDAIARSPDFEERISAMDAERDKLLALGYRDLNKYERFVKANMENDYKTTYNLLCCAAHNDYRALRERHFEDKEGKPSFYFFKEADTEDLEIFFVIASELLIRASFAIHALLSSGKLDELAKLRAELNSIRDEA